MSFYTKESTDFLKTLSQHNNREWFAVHKEDYESHLKEPSIHFASRMEQRLQDMTGHEYKSKLFRIYRDVRFSKDKTPYHTHQRISFIPLLNNDVQPAWFFSLEKDHFILGTGLFALQKQALENWRNLVSGHAGQNLLQVMNDMEDQGLRVNEADLKRVPSGFASNHPNQRLLRRKGLSVWMDFNDVHAAYGEIGLNNVITGYQKLRPVFDRILKLQEGK